MKIFVTCVIAAKRNLAPFLAFACFFSFVLAGCPDTAWAGNFEVGSVALNDTFSTASFVTVNYTNTYATVPVVFVIATSDGSNPCSIRIRNRTTTGCEMCQVEPDPADGIVDPKNETMC